MSFDSSNTLYSEIVFRLEYTGRRPGGRRLVQSLNTLSVLKVEYLFLYFHNCGNNIVDTSLFILG